MQKDTDQTSDATEETRSKGLIIDLDHVALDGHTLLFEAFAKVLKTKDVKFTLALYGRYCVSQRLEDCVPELLVAIGKKQMSTDKMVSDVRAAYGKALAADKVKPMAAIDKLLSAAAKDGFALGAVSSLPKDDAAALAEDLGLGKMDVVVVGSRNGNGEVVDGDTWRQMTGLLGVPVAACVGVTADAATTRRVLSAGLNVAVAPAAMTAFDDFSGADVVVDELNTAAISSILGIVGHD